MLLLSASFMAKHTRSYLFDGNVEFAKGCLLGHALVVFAPVDDSKAEGEAEVVSAEDSDKNVESVVVLKEDSDEAEDVSDAAELETGDTVR